MKANEYIKKFGWDGAKEILFHNQDLMNIGFFIDLKRLVKSREWIGLCGGLEDARALAVVHNDAALFESIADVESCMEVAQ